jgi:hypothetical protein
MVSHSLSRSNDSVKLFLKMPCMVFKIIDFVLKNNLVTFVKNTGKGKMFIKESMSFFLYCKLIFFSVYSYVQCLGHLSLLPLAPPYLPHSLASRQNLFCPLLQFR